MSENKKIILIFEDNPDIRTLLKYFFLKRGFEPQMFEDSMDAAEQARKHAPALIMLDMIMPGKDGVETCQDLRRAGIQTPILMLTSKSFVDDRARALAAGANAYLLKPFDPATLESVIKPLLAL